MLLDAAREMHLDVRRSASGSWTVSTVVGPVVTTRVPPRHKRIQYDARLLPSLDPSRQYGPADVVTAAMKVFARDRRWVVLVPRLVPAGLLDDDPAGIKRIQALAPRARKPRR